MNHNQHTTKSSSSSPPRAHIHTYTSSPTSTTKKRFKGQTIKNVTGTGEDYTPFVGCDINDLISNLNNSTCSINSDDDVLDKSMNTNTPMKQCSYKEIETNSNSNNSKSSISHKSLSNVMGSPSSVDLFNMCANSNNDEDDIIYIAEQHQQQHETYDDNSTIATIGTNATLTSYQHPQHQTTRVKLFHDDKNETDFVKKMSSLSSTNKDKITDDDNNNKQDLNHKWETYWSSEHDCPYYFNKQTNEVTWENPYHNNNNDHNSSKQIAINVTKDNTIYEDEYVPMADYTKTSTSIYATTNTVENETVTNTKNNDHINSSSSSSIQSTKTIVTNTTTISTTWERYWSDEHECEYFHNPITGETRWDNPNKKKKKHQILNSDYSTTSSVRSGVTTTGACAGTGTGNGNGNGNGNGTGTNDTRTVGGNTADVITVGEFDNVENNDFEDDEIVEISDFTKKKTNGNKCKEYDNHMIHTESNQHNMEKREEPKRNSKMTASTFHIKILNKIQRIFFQLRNNYNVNIEMTGADLAYKRKMNLLRKRKRKRIRKKAFDIICLILITIACNRLIKSASTRTEMESIDNSSNSSLVEMVDINEQIIMHGNKIDNEMTFNEGIKGIVQVQHQPALNDRSANTHIQTTDNAIDERPMYVTEIDNRNTKSETTGPVTNKYHDVAQDTITLSSSVSSSLSEPTQILGVNGLHKLSLSIEESLKFIQSSKKSIDNEGTKQIDNIEKKLDELRLMLKHLNVGKVDAIQDEIENLSHSTINEANDTSEDDDVIDHIERNEVTSCVEVASSKTKGDKAETLEEGGYDAASKKFPHSEMDNKVITPEGITQTISQPQNRITFDIQTTLSTAIKSKDSSRESIEPSYDQVEKETKKDDNIEASGKALPPVTKEKKEVQQVLSGAHYFSKFRKVMHAIDLALDIHLDVDDFGDFRNENEIASATIVNSNQHNIEEAFTKCTTKTATHLVLQARKTIPEFHKRLETGAKLYMQFAKKLASDVKKTVPIGAEIVVTNGKRAMNTMKNKMDMIGTNTKVITAKNAMLTTAQIIGKNMARETVSYIKTLDYDDLVEHGFISKNIIFPDTRAIHCQLPLFKKIIRGCDRGNEKQSRPGTGNKKWKSSSTVFVDAKETILSVNDGWSTPVWRACEKKNDALKKHHLLLSTGAKAMSD